ncbi:uncharacterized protein LOC111055569 [Nilaparvata lugens]|uniref:uncharacterized protein LOC111055569 n=1 Tax=Nilaparvata lugens TaxID=108931 RepID=UPI00193E9EC4|nr:uncharacterized protein LOC111055569 [Nilaparvata lugens]
MRNHRQIPFISFLIVGWSFIFNVQAEQKSRDLSGLVGETVELPCAVDTEKCGELHSIKWYRASSRIYVFSEMAGIARSENDYTDRAELQYTANSTLSYLRVKRLQVSDEAVYKCEITYLEVLEGCQVVQFINLTTLIKPEYMKLTREDGSEVTNSSVIGPLVEGDSIVLRCESGGGKPIPSVTWWNGSYPMAGTYDAQSGSNGIGTGVSVVSVRVGRGDLSAKYECRSQNNALPEPIVSWVEIDVNVRPINLALSGIDKHVIQGEKVKLHCIVRGARPPANITWYNGTEPLPQAISESSVQKRVPNTTVVIAADGTYDTQSYLEFVASRFENDETLSCEATNAIMRDRQETPMRDTLKLEVMYPPIVTVTPENYTEKEGTDILLFCQYEANPATLKSATWRKDNEPLALDSGHYEGGTPEQTTLLIKNSTRKDHGIYSCILENEVGASESISKVNLSIHFKPVVNVTMDPPSPVSEVDRQNISLLCQVVAGNPDTLTSVIWYLDGETLKALPDCETPNSTFCDIDPSKLLLENVERSFHGNYSCMGMNAAGWGPVSNNTELVVYYPPGRAKLTYSPERVVKKGRIQLTCSVEDPGRPDNPTYHWFRNYQALQQGPVTANYTIDPVTLETDANFTCSAVNLGGESESDTVHIKVFAPPAFIERLPPYYGALMNAQKISISCRVECSPICSIVWTKNGRVIDQANTRYSVQTSILRPDTRTNDFESVHSTLMWNMSAWPGNQLDRIHDNSNYTCQSTGNAVGPGVKSTTIFGVEYPPENLTVSNKVVNVIEGNIPEKVLCNAKGYPEPSYNWWREDSSEPVVKGNNALTLNYPVRRRNGGNYICEAFNRHGNNTIKTFVNVLYKPECGITQSEMDGKLVLICTAHANPTEVDFTWRIKNENETIEENIEKRGLQSFLTLETRVENFRTYLCFTNNSVGMSIPCERDVTAYQEKSSKFRATGRKSDQFYQITHFLPIISSYNTKLNCQPNKSQRNYWKEMGVLQNINVQAIFCMTCSHFLLFCFTCLDQVYLRDLLFVYVLLSITSFIFVFAKEDYIRTNKCLFLVPPFGFLDSSPVELEDRQNPEGNSGPVASPTPVAVTATPKWPLRPGVLVHVNTSHSLSRLSQAASPTAARSTNQNTPAARSTNQRQERRAISLANIANENQHSRANRIRHMFTPEQRIKYRSDTLPGVFHGKSGVVTFKKLDGTNFQGASRKRKKPGASPNPSSTKDKSDLNSSSPSDALLQPDGDNKAFYENLPFHGMQNPPNKTPTLDSVNSGAAPAVSRPPSELSQYAGSSGYGSTRSQLGPSLQSSEPPNPNSSATDDRKFASLRNCKRSRSDWPQFRSLRASKQSMRPIIENSLETKTKPPAKEPPDCPELRLKSPPTPAPRKFTPPNCRQTSPKHTYQNIPIPITPNNSSKTEFPEVNSSQSPHCSLTNSSTLERQRLLLNGRQSLKKQKALLKPSRPNNELVTGQDEFAYSSYQRTNHHIMHSSPPPTYNGGGGPMYADLALNNHHHHHHHHRPHPHAPVPEHFPLYQPPRAHTDYAIIKFHDVGQEIDV